MKKLLTAAIAAIMSLTMLVPCMAAEESTSDTLADGIYYVEFDTDSSMFHVNETDDGKGIMVVDDGEMTVHVSLAGTGYINVYLGLAADAKEASEKEIIQPTTDRVTYSDGLTEEVYGFNIPVPVLDEEYDVALLGKKSQEWKDHKVSVSNPEPYADAATVEDLGLEDGKYRAELIFTGGSGKAYIASPCELEVADGEAYATVQWSSEKYDYMLVGGEKYIPDSTEGGSTFTIPVETFNSILEVVGDTTAMGEPHEIEYSLVFLADSVEAAE